MKSILFATASLAFAALSLPTMASDGKAVYDKGCATCHNSGVAGAPKLGDKAVWDKRLGAGKDALVTAALKGKGAMPAKGGNSALTEGEIKAAVDYMLAAVK